MTAPLERLAAIPGPAHGVRELGPSPLRACGPSVIAGIVLAP